MVGSSEQVRLLGARLSDEGVTVPLSRHFRVIDLRIFQLMHGVTLLFYLFVVCRLGHTSQLEGIVDDGFPLAVHATEDDEFRRIAVRQEEGSVPVDAGSVDRIVYLGVQIYSGEGVGQVG